MKQSYKLITRQDIMQRLVTDHHRLTTAKVYKYDKPTEVRWHKTKAIIKKDWVTYIVKE